MLEASFLIASYALQLHHFNKYDVIEALDDLIDP